MARMKSVLNTPLNMALAGGLGLLLAYAFASRAIETGSLMQYAATLLLVVLSLKLLIRSFKTQYGK
jgi:hypothetical protein